MLNQKRKTTVVIFGTIMFEEAKKKGLKNRDEMRRMSVEDQRRLQDLAAQRITEMRDDIVMIDTHLFINTDEGYYPGLPRSEEHTSELQSLAYLVCRLLLE